MNSEKDVLEIIRNKFPGKDGRVNFLYREDPDFRSLCSDYFFCLKNLINFKKLSEAEQQAIEEYKNVMEELEKELYDFLSP
jgi:hypothetical protein